MTATIDMKIVLRTLRGARSLAVETLKRDFPDLYVLSADAFDISASGSIDHHIRLGEFLTEWDNSLGRSPVEALASGQRDNVLRILADRIGSDLEFDQAAEPESPLQVEQNSGHAPCVAYCNYYATGEGATHFIAAGSSVACAEHAFRQHVPDYFQRGMETAPVDGEWSSAAVKMLQLIPQFAADIIAKNPPGTTYYYATLHFNLA